jgi:formylmethanofuran dehydrogenase subunit C
VSGGSITVTGNVTGKRVGAHVRGGGEVTIDGEINGTLTDAYIRIDSTDKTKDDFEATTTKAGYRTYTDGTSTVWVKEN